MPSNPRTSIAHDWFEDDEALLRVNGRGVPFSETSSRANVVNRFLAALKSVAETVAVVLLMVAGPLLLFEGQTLTGFAVMSVAVLELGRRP